jgi:transposase-like protein
MASDHRSWTRQSEAFWRAHHEAWKRSDLNQRQYCEAEEIPLKAFGNWRAQFKAEPQPPERKLLYRRRPLSPPLSPPVSPPFSQVTYPSSRPIVPRPREGHRRRFSDADKQRILEEAAQPDASAAQVARRYGIAQRLLRRWKQELATTALAFVTVQVTDVDAPPRDIPTAAEAMS